MTDSPSPNQPETAADRVRAFVKVIDEWDLSWSGDCIYEDRGTPLNQSDLRALLAERDYLAKKNMDFNQLQEDYDVVSSERDALAVENATLREALRGLLGFTKMGEFSTDRLEQIVALAVIYGAENTPKYQEARAVLAARALLSGGGTEGEGSDAA